eukprot:comp23657_c0_seq1/m.40423 comp23657_c0_seq1/g.40423  ORF comp23657_c0_seq1/g.40423 comp23657_c0_seq1/m.40423 type:complete len:1229 (-) comp23657_c0_seq1:226-3912(-)
MCRLMAYIGKPILVADLVTYPSRSIITQSFDSRERLTDIGYLNGDGFGLGWYSPEVAIMDPTPCVFKSINPAWNNDNLRNLTIKIISPLVFAHVRAATPGQGVNESNCHPFHSGRYMFMHNGQVGGLTKIKRRLMSNMKDHAFDYACKHSSDSALSFALFLDQLENNMEIHTADEMRRMLQNVVKKITDIQEQEGVQEISMLNYVVSDGFTIVATRWVRDPTNPEAAPASLYMAAGANFEVVEGTEDSLHPEYQISHDDRRNQVAIITSEPLTDDPLDWLQIKKNHIVVITSDLHVLTSPINLHEFSSSAHLSMVGPSMEGGESMVQLASQMGICLELITSRKSMQQWTAEGIVASLSSTSLFWGEGSGNLASTSRDVKPGRMKARVQRRNSVKQLQDRMAQQLSDSVYDPEASGKPRSLLCPQVMSSSKHIMRGHQHTVLALAHHPAKQLLFSASRDGDVRVWDMNEFQCIEVIKAHSRGVLCMALQGDLLATGSGDRTVKLWDVNTFECVGLIQYRAPCYSLLFVGDLLLQGLGDCSIYYSNSTEIEPPHPSMTEARKMSSRPLCDIQANVRGVQLRPSTSEINLLLPDHVRKLGTHCGFVYCLAYVAGYVCSGSGDSSIKVWNIKTKRLEHHLLGHRAGVFALAADEHSPELFSGSTDGTIKVWDMSSFGCKRTLYGHHATLSLALTKDFLFSGGTGGYVIVWSRTNYRQLVALHEANTGIQALLACPRNPVVFSGATDTLVRMWNIDSIMSWANPINEETPEADPIKAITKPLEEVLRDFVAIQSVSSDESLRLECWKGAKFLFERLEELGAIVKLVNNPVEGKNPIVLGRLGHDPKKPTITIYGHYDVQPAVKDEWVSDPWTITAISGYLYGRGSSDDKGPILAGIYAAKELLDQGDLPVNLVFAYEGECEQSIDASVGFNEAINNNISWFEGTDMVLVSNNYWLSEEQPCLTWGMRGIINLEVTVSGPKQNLHSGVDGGAVIEPISDLMGVLSSLVDVRGMVMIPGFYDKVRPLSDEEKELYDQINFQVKAYRESLGVRSLCSSNSSEVLMARWREPSLSVTGIHTSNQETSYTVIPHVATGDISIRFVPDQESEHLVQLLADHLRHEFRKRQSPNQLTIKCLHKADWWLGDPTSPIFNSAERAIQKVWGTKPLYVREGGTMAITSFLEKTLSAPALHLPLGQASDNAHLANERIRISNLRKGTDVMRELFVDLGQTLKATH